MDEEYYAGKGCRCSAQHEGECGCEVDWTDPQVYKLQAKLKRYEEGIKQAIDIIGQAGEIMTLKQLSKWEGYRGYIENWDERLKEE